FRVTNQGGSNLNISRVTVPSGYTITDNLGGSIAPGNSDTLTIRLDSSSAGTKSGDVNISSNDGDENPFNFAITGKVASSIGGGGADTLHGGSGNDSIVGGFGADQLFGDDGDDKIDAVDGTPDLKVDGGAGNDTIKADPTDSKTGT